MRAYLFLALLTCCPGAAGAAEFVVDNPLDGGAGSLRSAIELANGSPGADRILFDPTLAGETLWIESPAPVIGEGVELVGPTGAAAAVLRGTGSDRVLVVVTAQGDGVVLRGLVLAGGRHANSSGGCLEIRGASVLLDHVRVTECEAVFGGAISATSGATLELRHSRVDHSRALRSGGGIHAAGPMVVADSEIDHNAIDGAGYINGGGIAFAPADTQSLLWIVDSQLHHNSALTSTPGESGSGSAGGALNASRGSLVVERSAFHANLATFGAAMSRNGYSGDVIGARIVNSTFARNFGGSAVAILTGSIQLEHSTISDNHRFDGIGWAARAFDAWAVVPVSFLNSVVAGNYPGENGVDVATGGTPIDAGFSLIGSADGGSIDPSNPGTNLFGVDPQLRAIDWNGGPTPTMLPRAASPLVDAGTATGMPPTDQRGFARQSGPGVDIGAVERDGDHLFADGFEDGLAD